MCQIKITDFYVQSRSVLSGSGYFSGIRLIVTVNFCPRFWIKIPLYETLERLFYLTVLAMKVCLIPFRRLLFLFMICIARSIADRN